MDPDYKVTGRRPRMFELQTLADNSVPPAFDDWPDNLKDAIYEKLESMIQQTGVKEVEIVETGCWEDEHLIGIWHVRILVVEKLGIDDLKIEILQ